MATRESPLASRKFIAYMFADAAWTILIGGGLYRLEWILTNAEEKVAAAGSVLTLMMTMVIVKGFVQTMYIGGQSFIDRYVEVARITAGKSENSQQSQSTKSGEDE